MKPEGRPFLVAGGVASILIAVLHLAVIVAGPAGYRYFGAGRLVPLAERGSFIPALVTLVIAAIFAVWGLFGLSGAGLGPRLPLLRPALVTIGVIYCLRGLLLVPALVRLAQGRLLFPRVLVFSAVGLLIGLLYLVGTALAWRSLEPREGMTAASRETSARSWMATDRLRAALPRSKHDLAAASAIVALGYPAVAPVLGELLEWLQDFNWPVAKVLAPFLASIGEGVVPHVRRVLCSEDEVWKYWVLTVLVAELPATAAAGLLPELRRMASEPTPGEVRDEVDMAAREVLAALGAAG